MMKRERVLVDGLDHERPGAVGRIGQRGARPARVEDERVPRIVDGQRRLADAARLSGGYIQSLSPSFQCCSARNQSSRGSSSRSRRGPRGSRSCRSQRGPGRSARPRAKPRRRARESGPRASRAASPARAGCRPEGGRSSVPRPYPSCGTRVGRPGRRPEPAQKNRPPAWRPERQDRARYFSGFM